MIMDHHYARKKLQALLLDLDLYNGDEFWRQMSRIAEGATGEPHAETLQADLDTIAATRQAIGDLIVTDYSDRDDYHSAIIGALMKQPAGATERVQASALRRYAKTLSPGHPFREHALDEAQRLERIASEAP